MDGFVPCEALDQQQICTGILRRRCRLRATAHFLLALPKAAMQCIAAIWRWQNACGRTRWIRSDIRITKKKPSDWMVFMPCEALDQQQICTGILRRRCRLRATAHFLLALPKAAMQCIAAIWRWQNACGRTRWIRSDIRITKKKPSEWMVSFLVTRTGIEPMLPP